MNLNDFDTLKEIFEMAEVLDFEGSDYLEIMAFDERTNNNATVTFKFNEEGELLGEINVQE